MLYYIVKCHTYKIFVSICFEKSFDSKFITKDHGCADCYYFENRGDQCNKDVKSYQDRMGICFLSEEEEL